MCFLHIMKNDSVIFYLGDMKRNHSLMFFESSKFRISIANMRLSFVFTIENFRTDQQRLYYGEDAQEQ